MNVKKTLEYLALLGYNLYNNESSTAAITITRDKKLDLAKKQSSRNVYCCHVIGPKSAGKTTLCRSFVDPKLEVINLVISLHQIKKFLPYNEFLFTFRN